MLTQTRPGVKHYFTYLIILYTLTAHFRCKQIDNLYVGLASNKNGDFFIWPSLWSLGTRKTGSRRLL